VLASAALDRLTQGAHFVEITGASFRAEHTKKQTAPGGAGPPTDDGHAPLTHTEEEPAHLTALLTMGDPGWLCLGGR
jgi:hypothetical protein